jgi:antirestriction protein ArdC
MTKDLCGAFWESIPYPPKIIYREPEEENVLAKFDSDSDTIIMFISQDHGYSFFYQTLFHDLTHREVYLWLMDEGLPIDMLTGEYEPFDELIAETGASIMCKTTGIYQETKVDHLDYIDYQKIRLQDKRLLLEVFPFVSNAMNRILGRTISRSFLPIEVRLALLKIR